MSDKIEVGDFVIHTPTNKIVKVLKVGQVTFDILDEYDIYSIVPYEDIKSCPLSFNMSEVVERDVQVLEDIGSLCFSKLRRVGYERAITAFKHDEGLTDWSPGEWTNALAGEVGELCNLTKKMKRDGNIPLEEIGKEIADVVIYADLVATRFGLKLEDLVRQKFNEVSDRKGSDIKL
jgi:NTP pyrophosphatase (non-canonical NTP hydrolase)